MSEWISVKERLPEETYLVLVWDNDCDQVAIASLQRDGSWCGDGVWKDANVTHWMPLPEPPEED